MSKYDSLLQNNEMIFGMTEYPEHGTQEWAYGYADAHIGKRSGRNSTDSVLIAIEPFGAIEPVLITEDVSLSFQVLEGEGSAVICNINDDDDAVKIVEINPDMEPITLTKGSAYFYLNQGDKKLIIRDDSTPKHEDAIEIRLTLAPEEDDEADGRKIELPVDFWKAFGLNETERREYLNGLPQDIERRKIIDEYGLSPEVARAFIEKAYGMTPEDMREGLKGEIHGSHDVEAFLRMALGGEKFYLLEEVYHEVRLEVEDIERTEAEKEGRKYWNPIPASSILDNRRYTFREDSKRLRAKFSS